jgi:hypothetical protein
MSIVGPPVPGRGHAVLSAAVPPSIPSATFLAIQAAVLDSSAGFGWAATNAVALTIP